MNYYEGLYILDSGRFARDPDGTVRQITDAITDAGGEVLVSRMWEERRLAYPIKKQRKGTYWLVYFKLDGGRLDDVRARLQHADYILRYMHVRIDPRIIDVLVEHARGGLVSPRGLADEGEDADHTADSVEAAADAESED
ncbi:MAG: 30S ribosomal protein S6 [Thermogutta sp.]|nr:30S ribosomal protein S6 [Thermogutta sp.]